MNRTHVAVAALAVVLVGGEAIRVCAGSCEPVVDPTQEETFRYVGFGGALLVELTQVVRIGVGGTLDAVEMSLLQLSPDCSSGPVWATIVDVKDGIPVDQGLSTPVAGGAFCDIISWWEFDLYSQNIHVTSGQLIGISVRSIVVEPRIWVGGEPGDYVDGALYTRRPQVPYSLVPHAVGSFRVRVCPDIVSVEPTTWGATKGLYRP